MERLTITSFGQPDPPIEYAPLPGEREAFVALAGGEAAYLAWCYETLYGTAALQALLDRARDGGTADPADR